MIAALGDIVGVDARGLAAPIDVQVPEGILRCVLQGTLDVLATRRGLQDLTITASGYGLSYSSPVKVESFRSRLTTVTPSSRKG
mgnify:CR=1 FL=1